jgi:hypothetical protein
VLALGVDESGRVVCYDPNDLLGQPQTLKAERRAAIAGMSEWRYSPFLRNGSAVSAIVSENMNEHEMPQQHSPRQRLSRFVGRVEHGTEEPTALMTDGDES